MFLGDRPNPARVTPDVVVLGAGSEFTWIVGPSGPCSATKFPRELTSFIRPFFPKIPNLKVIKSKGSERARSRCDKPLLHLPHTTDPGRTKGPPIDSGIMCSTGVAFAGPRHQMH